MTDRLDSSPVLKEVLGDSLEKLQMFHDMLEKEGEIRGLISPNDIDIIWERHILNSAAVVPFILKSAERKKSETEQNNENVSRETSNKKLRIADIGSGGGFPGIIRQKAILAREGSLQYRFICYEMDARYSRAAPINAQNSA